MNSRNESVIQVWHKYQNIVKPFFFSCGAYRYQKTTEKLAKDFQRFLRILQNTTEKLAKAFERFLRILLQLCRSRFRLIISEQKFRYKSHGTGVEKELFRAQSGIQTKYG